MRLILISDLDDFIITAFVGIVAAIFLMYWVIIKLKSMKSINTPIFSTELEDQLDNYTFNFENTIASKKTFSVNTKIIACLVSFMIVVLPLYEMIETLRPIEMVYRFSCFY